MTTIEGFEQKWAAREAKDQNFSHNMKLIQTLNDAHREQSRTDLHIVIKDMNWYNSTDAVMLSYTNWPNTEIQHLTETILNIPHGDTLTEEQLGDIAKQATAFDAKLYQERWAR